MSSLTTPSAYAGSFGRSVLAARAPNTVRHRSAEHPSSHSTRPHTPRPTPRPQLALNGLSSNSHSRKSPSKRSWSNVFFTQAKLIIALLFMIKKQYTKYQKQNAFVVKIFSMLITGNISDLSQDDIWALLTVVNDVMKVPLTISEFREHIATILHIDIDVFKTVAGYFMKNFDRPYVGKPAKALFTAMFAVVGKVVDRTNSKKAKQLHEYMSTLYGQYHQSKSQKQKLDGPEPSSEGI